MVVEDDKIMTDDIFDQILAWEDQVQSVDIFNMQKVWDNFAKIDTQNSSKHINNCIISYIVCSVLQTIFKDTFQSIAYVIFFSILFSLKNWEIKVFYEVDTTDKEGKYIFYHWFALLLLTKISRKRRREIVWYSKE